MGLFDFLKPKSNNRQFVSETAFNSNRDKQVQMTPQTRSSVSTVWCAFITRWKR